jgi:hypothetical protein
MRAASPVGLAVRPWSAGQLLSQNISMKNSGKVFGLYLSMKNSGKVFGLYLLGCIGGFIAGAVVGFVAFAIEFVVLPRANKGDVGDEGLGVMAIFYMCLGGFIGLVSGLALASHKSKAL